MQDERSMDPGFLDAAPEAIVMVDTRGEIVFLNAQAEKLLGHTREAVQGHPLSVLWPAFGQKGENDDKALTAALAKGR
jgi:PAS domain S-box-containing protein